MRDWIVWNLDKVILGLAVMTLVWLVATVVRAIWTGKKIFEDE